MKEVKEEFQSILLEDLDMRWPGWRLLRLALNRHMPRVEKLSEHRHEHSQYLLYLRGSGSQLVGRESHPVRPGSILYIPAERTHGFVKSRHQRPVCLAIDFIEEPLPAISGGEIPPKAPESERPASRRAGELPPRARLQVERWLFELGQRSKESPEQLPIASASLILQILAALADALHRKENAPADGPVARAVSERIRDLGFDHAAPGEVARSLGQSLDHLNRLLRDEGAPTVGKLLLGQRLHCARTRLAGSDRAIGDIAAECGFYDQNYFARWFRKHTGQSPSGWRKARAGE